MLTFNKILLLGHLTGDPEQKTTTNNKTVTTFGVATNHIGTDAFRFPVTLDAGWNRLVHKVYDGGGGWGQVVRFYEVDGTTPMTDLALSLAGPMDWTDNQGDLDSDGIGDFCDPTP